MAWSHWDIERVDRLIDWVKTKGPCEGLWPFAIKKIGRKPLGGTPVLLIVRSQFLYWMECGCVETEGAKKSGSKKRSRKRKKNRAT